MRSGTFVLVLAGMAALAGIALVLITRAKSKGDPGQRFKAKAFMTANELEFLARLEAAVPDLRFHAQVAMGALLDAATPRRENVRAHMRARGQFSQKIIDFVAQHRSTGAVVAVIELDDRTHDSTKDQSRDAMLREGGYKVIRWQSKAKPDAPAIRQALREAPVAPG